MANRGSSLELIKPRWGAPAKVRAVTSTRRGGFSSGDFAALNLANHVGDDPALVAANRALLRESLALPAEPLWLDQVHGCDVAVWGNGAVRDPISEASSAEGEPTRQRLVQAVGGNPERLETVRCDAAEQGADEVRRPRADASVVCVPGRVCVVMTADCLPLLFCDDSGDVVAAAHAGWRGLLEGVIEATVAAMQVAPERIHAWLGPAIGPNSFEVGPEVRDRFCDRSAEAEAGFVPGVDGRWLADLYLLARQRLLVIGVQRISGGEHCTFVDRERFFSYRRDGRTGRMASLIWIDSSEPA